MDIFLVNIISNGGLTLHSSRFKENTINEILFSGLTGAISTFAKELGDELFCITMKSHKIYFRQLSDDSSVVIIASSKTSDKIINRKLEKLEKSNNLKLILQYESSLGMVLTNANEKFDRELRKLFRIYLNN